MSNYSIHLAENFMDVKKYLQICVELMQTRYQEIPLDEINLYQ